MNAGSKADHISHTPDVAECNGNAQMTTDGADKRHRKWGIGLCALGVIYYFTVYSIWPCVCT